MKRKPTAKATPDALVRDGFARQERGDHAGAEPLYRQALALDGEHHQAMNLLAMIHLERGEPGEALALITRALDFAPPLAPEVAWYQLNRGHALAGLGRDADAVAAIEAAIARDRRNPIPRYDLARHHLRHGRRDLALAALYQVLACEPGHARAQFLVASLSGGHADHPPAAYVTELFDSYAASFEDHVVHGLAYRVPGELAALVADTGFAAGRVLDLGCGSGLCGAAFRAHARELIGSDLSAKMIERARARGVYDALYVEDLLASLARATGDVDLIVAADVFIYVGALDAVFAAAARALVAGGRFAFSVERAAGDGVALQTSSRYAHGDAYIRALAAQHGFTVHTARDTVIRTDQHTAIAGVLYLVIAA